MNGPTGFVAMTELEFAVLGLVGVMGWVIALVAILVR